MAKSKGAPEKVRARERELRALELRKAGATYRRIGEHLGITEQGAHKAVMRALNKLIADVSESADQLRELEVQRLDAMLLGLWDQARLGDVKAVTASLRVMERRARMLGLDLPPNISQDETDRRVVEFRLVGSADGA